MSVQVVEIQAIGRSGSIFLQGLLDGHLQLVTIPGRDYIFKTEFEGKTIEQICRIIWLHKIKYYYKSFAGKKPIVIGYFRFADKRKAPFSYNEFQKPFIDYLAKNGVNRKNIFIALHYAYATAMGFDFNKIKYIVYQGHDPFNSIALQKDFPNHKIIFIMRDMRPSFVSYKKRIGVNAWLYTIAYRLKYNNYYLKINNSKISITHEQLHTNYPIVKKNICKFLRISEDKHLNNCSFFGKTYDGKTLSKWNSLSKFSSTPNPKYVNRKWIKNISKNELKIHQWLFSNFNKEFAYANIINAEGKSEYNFSKGLFELLPKTFFSKKFCKWLSSFGERISAFLLFMLWTTHILIQKIKYSIFVV